MFFLRPSIEVSCLYLYKKLPILISCIASNDKNENGFRYLMIWDRKVGGMG